MSQHTLVAMLFTLAGVLPWPLNTQEIQQSAQVLIVTEGESVNITCSTSEDLEGIYLSQIWPQYSEVIYYEDKAISTIDGRFSDRIVFSGPQNSLTITMLHLQPEDTGVYTCKAVTESRICGLVTTVLVREKLSQEAHRAQEPLMTSVSLPAALAVGFFLVGLILGMLCTLRKTQIKKLCASRDTDPRFVVYEDMSYNNRKIPCAPNEYR